jgi:RNA-binding protein YhbY
MIILIVEGTEIMMLFKLRLSKLVDFFLCLLLFCPSAFTRDYISEYERMFRRDAETVQPQKAPEEQEKSFAVVTIDLMLATMLHPVMRDYNFVVDSFAAPLPEKLAIDPRFYMKEQHDRFIGKQEELQQRIKERDQKIFELQSAVEGAKVEYANRMQFLQQQAREENWPAERLNNDLQKMEKDLWGNVFRFNQQIEETGKEFEQWQEKELVNVFMDRAARDAVFSGIAQEIQEIISTLMQERGINLVLNRPARTKPQLKTPTLKEIHLLAASREQNTLGAFMDGEVFLGHDSSQATIERLYIALESHFRYYGRLMDFFAPVTDGTIFGVSGDITLDVLKKIWEKHKLSPELISKLEAAAKVWLSGGRR